MVRILQNEAETLAKNAPNIKFMKMSVPKNKGGKTYYLVDDSPYMYMLAEMRGYKDIIYKVKKDDEEIEKVYSAKQQCIDENIYI